MNLRCLFGHNWVRQDGITRCARCRKPQKAISYADWLALPDWDKYPKLPYLSADGSEWLEVQHIINKLEHGEK